MLTFHEREALLKIFEFVENDLVWFEPDSLEKEPGYTARVLAPQFEYFLKKTRSPFVLRADGRLRPQPVVFKGWSNFPDLAFNVGIERTVAVEVKFFSGPADKGALTTAIGQAVLYASGGYKTSFVILVARQAGTTLSLSDVTKIGRTLKSLDLGIFTLS